jgi:hypothetical protein
MVEQTMLTGLYRALLKTIELSKERSRLEVICSAIHSNLASQEIDAESDNFSETLYLVCGQYGSDLLETNTDLAKSFETISTHLEKNLLETPPVDNTAFSSTFYDEGFKSSVRLDAASSHYTWQCSCYWCPPPTVKHETPSTTF